MTSARISSPEIRLIDLMAKFNRLEIEFISLGGEIKQAAAEWLAEIRKPVPEAKPRRLTISGIADEFFTDAYPDNVTKRRKAARRFCEKHNLTHNAGSPMLINANDVEALFKRQRRGSIA